MKNDTLKKIFISALLVLVGVISFFYLGDIATDISTHEHTLTSIDEKTETVLKLTGASTVASAGISVIPGDAGTPIAEKLADFSQYFLLILCVLYAEKYALTIIGLASFKILIPLACLFMIFSLFRNPSVWRRLAVKLAVFAVAIYIIIPTSIKVSDMIYETYDESISTTISAAEQIAGDTTEFSDAGEDDGLVQSILQSISETASSLTDRAADTLNRFVETLAVLIVTSCIIPILVIIFFVWVAKIITGVNFMPDVNFSGKFFKGHRGGRKPPELESGKE